MLCTVMIFDGRQQKPGLGAGKLSENIFFEKAAKNEVKIVVTRIDTVSYVSQKPLGHPWDSPGQFREAGNR